MLTFKKKFDDHESRSPVISSEELEQVQEMIQNSEQRVNVVYGGRKRQREAKTQASIMNTIGATDAYLSEEDFYHK